MQATTTTSCWQRVRARARAQGEGEANHATNHHRNARTHTHTRTLSIRLSAVRGIRYRHNRRAEPSSTGKSTAISAFPFTRITDSAWQAANHAAKAWPLHLALPFHCTPTLPAARPLDLAPPPPLLSFARPSRALFLFLLFSRDPSSVEREREEQGFAARFSIPREPRLRLSYTRHPFRWGERAAKIFRGERGTYCESGTGDLYADRRCRSKSSGGFDGEIRSPVGNVLVELRSSIRRSRSLRRNIEPFPIRHARGITISNRRADIFPSTVSRNERGREEVHSINTRTGGGGGYGRVG